MLIQSVIMWGFKTVPQTSGHRKGKGRPEKYLIYKIFRAQNIPGEPFVPIVGQVPDIRAYAKVHKGRNEYEFDLNVKHGDICIIMQGPSVCLLIRDASFISDALKKYSKYYIKSKLFRTVFSALMGEHNLLVSEGDVHDRSRKALGTV
ncbi:unnamed protein product [Didymodactylos carnosus]|uniref:Cytochrome P450 n=1 Tax=Didymodactylos carnosus TaxID=1234261 RepID=A0A815JIE9_9BILA|nr:unnamed protein product [Didymodactylos carnosus]CAF4277743.1 unnamed protein product [Didymodactylos carnosus]